MPHTISYAAQREKVSFRQVGKEPTLPMVPRVPVHKARRAAGPPSIPGKHAVVLRRNRAATSGFGGSTRRFIDPRGREQRQVPGPGSYRRSSSSSVTVAASASSERTFVSRATRFSARAALEASSMPGPGQYGASSSERPETRTKTTFGVAERSAETVRATVRAATRARRGPNRPLVDGWGEDAAKDPRSTPGPGYYGYGARTALGMYHGTGGAASAFNSNSGQRAAVRYEKSPAPNRYNVAGSVLQKRVNWLGSAAFLSSRKEGTEGAEGTPGPGSYRPLNGAFERSLAMDAVDAAAVATASAGAMLREQKSLRQHARATQSSSKRRGAPKFAPKAELVRVPLSALQAPRGGAGMASSAGGMLWRNASSTRGGGGESSVEVGGPPAPGDRTSPSDFRSLGLAATSVYSPGRRGVQVTVRPSSMFGLTRRDRFGRSLSGASERRAQDLAPGPAEYDAVDPASKRREIVEQESASWARSRSPRRWTPKDPNAGSPGPFETGHARWIERRSYLVGDGRWL